MSIESGFSMRRPPRRRRERTTCTLGPPRLRWAPGLLAGLLALATSHALSATFTVNDTTDAPDADATDGLCLSAQATCTLRASIMQANQTPGTDTILLPAGTFVLAIAGVDEDLSATGDLDIRYPVDLSGAGMEDTTIDAAGLDRVVHVRSSAGGTRVAGLTLRGGAPPNGSSFPAGGGIYNQAQELLLESVAIEDNVAADVGGGIASTATVHVQRSRIKGNASTTSGGGMFVFVAGSLTLHRSVVADNHAQLSGGGIVVRNGLDARQSTIAGNVAAGGGGGGLSINSLQLGDGYTLENVTISGNSANGSGGGLYADHDVSLTHVTVSGNSSGESGGGVFMKTGAPAALLQGSIIHGNNATSAGPDCSGSVVTTGGNLIGSTSGCGIVLTTGDAPPGANPQLGPLQGQPLPVHPIGATSPARDFVPTPCPVFDALDTPRPQGSDCDAGAYEIYVSGFAPVAIDDSYTNQPIGPVAIPAPGVLQNDYNSSGFPMTAQLEYIDPSSGAVTLNADGGFLFIPANFALSAPAFSYRAAIGQVVSNIATVTISRKLPLFEVPVLLEVPEIPWLFPGPYNVDCLAIWDHGTLAAQIAGAGAWNARQSGWTGGARSVEFEGWIEDYNGDRYTITGIYDGRVLEGSVLRPDRRTVPLIAEASETCNALTSYRR